MYKSAIKKVARYHKQKLFHDPTFVIKLLLRRRRKNTQKTRQRELLAD